MINSYKILVGKPKGRKPILSWKKDVKFFDCQLLNSFSRRVTEGDQCTVNSVVDDCFHILKTSWELFIEEVRRNDCEGCIVNYAYFCLKVRLHECRLVIGMVVLLRFDGGEVFLGDWLPENGVTNSVISRPPRRLQNPIVLLYFVCHFLIISK
jgi:hypothetical protein